MPHNPKDLIKIEKLPADDLLERSGPHTTSREDNAYLLQGPAFERLKTEIAEQLWPAVHQMLSSPNKKSLQEAVGQFFDLYPKRPVKNNKGGGQINDSLCLFVSAKLLAPEFILESGSFRGHSAWLLRQACPQADIITCDIDHSQLEHREESIRYHEGDWMDVKLPPFDPRSALGWFDDHINHALRLRQAYDKGFRRLLFDDNFPYWNLYATGGVPVPTLSMLMDSGLEDGMLIEWTRGQKKYSYRFTEEDVQGARALIRSYLPLPDLTKITRYSPPSGLTYIATIE